MFVSGRFEVPPSNAPSYQSLIQLQLGGIGIGLKKKQKIEPGGNPFDFESQDGESQAYFDPNEMVHTPARKVKAPEGLGPWDRSLGL